MSSSLAAPTDLDADSATEPTDSRAHCSTTPLVSQLAAGWGAKPSDVILHVCSIDDTQQQGEPDGETALPALFTWREMPMQLWSICRIAVNQHATHTRKHEDAIVSEFTIIRDRVTAGVDLYEWHIPFGVLVGRVSGNLQIGFLCFYCTFRCTLHWWVELQRKRRNDSISASILKCTAAPLAERPTAKVGR